VDAVYDVRADTVEQTLPLHSASVPASFSSIVTVPAGSALRAEDDGSVRVVNADGTVAGSLPPPVMKDSSGDLDHDTPPRWPTRSQFLAALHAEGDAESCLADRSRPGVPGAAGSDGDLRYGHDLGC
jgi:hypothetical protein